MDKFTLRPLQIEADLEWLTRLGNRYRSEPASPAYVREWIEHERPGRVCRIMAAAGLNGEPLGYSETVHETWHPAGQYRLWVQVDPRFERQGVGSTLYAEGLAYARHGDRLLQLTDDDGLILLRSLATGPGSLSLLLNMSAGEGEDEDYRFPLADVTGAVHRLADGPGSVTDHYWVDAYGVVDHLGYPETFTHPFYYSGMWGSLTDPSSLVQMGARFYWPALGRFLQQDPIRDGGNWYAYVGDNPVTGIDPAGFVVRLTGDADAYRRAVAGSRGDRVAVVRPDDGDRRA